MLLGLVISQIGSNLSIVNLLSLIFDFIPLTTLYPSAPTAIGIAAETTTPAIIPPPITDPIEANPEVIPAADNPAIPLALIADAIPPNPNIPPPTAPICSDIFSFSASDNFLNLSNPIENIIPLCFSNLLVG